MDRTRRLCLNLFPQLIHDHTEIVDLVTVVRSPDGLEQFAMAQDLVCMSHEVPEQLKFFRREAHLAIGCEDLAGVEIDFDVTELQSARWTLSRCRPAERRANARQKFRWIERLGDVVVRASVERTNLVGLAVPHG